MSDCTGTYTPPLAAGLCLDKPSHSSVVPKPPYVHISTRSQSLVHSLFIPRKNGEKKHSTHNPLPQSTGCNIPVSHPRLSNDDITPMRETGDWFTRYEVAWWVESDSKGSLSWAHVKIAVYPNKTFDTTSKTNSINQLCQMFFFLHRLSLCLRGM